MTPRRDDQALCQLRADLASTLILLDRAIESEAQALLEPLLDELSTLQRTVQRVKRLIRRGLSAEGS
jgi:hypothetical protein